ncbi:MAG: DUF1820 family protein [Pontibacterium sp.]
MTSKTTDNSPIYRILFINQDELYEMYARHVYQSDLWGFIQVEAFVFGNRSELLVDPGEEKLKQEFADVKCSYIPMQSIVRIDEVKREGVSKVAKAKAVVTPLPPTQGPKP